MSRPVVLHSECCLNITESEISLKLMARNFKSFLLDGVLKLVTECANIQLGLHEVL